MGYIDVAGHRTWHEVHDPTDPAAVVGRPVVLLHGAFGGADSFALHVPYLVARGRRVQVPERPGHAHTPDLDEPFTYAGMARQTADYLEAAVGEPADLVGWSDGAVVALLVARDRPDLVGRIVLIGQYYNSAGQAPGTELDDFLEDPRVFEGMQAQYAAVSPDGAGHFRTVYDKTMRMFATEPEIDLTTLAGVTAPTLVLQGDRDAVTVQHSQEVVAALPNARLAVLPGTHVLPLELPEVVNPLIAWFLNPDTRPADSLPG